MDKELNNVNLIIDGNPISVAKGTTVYQAAKEAGIQLPIFCYQDRMAPFGACRVCLVEVEKSPKLQASCTLQATEGMVVNTESAKAVNGRKEIIEFLLINHPLDCPICDRGGECPLQEQALSDGSGESRFYEEKRHFKKPLPLGPVLMLDRERCIICARCTRFGDIIAGDHALEMIDRGYKSEVGTPDHLPVKSKFIGNTISICPVGALTSQVYRFRARPWDNKPTSSTCTLCPIGCSLIFDSRDGEIMRTRVRENKEVNDIWLCDKGWFGYEFTSHPDRLKTPLIRRNNQLEPATWDEALELIAAKIVTAKPQGKIAAWGGTPLTVEENFLFQKLVRVGFGVKHVDYRVGLPIFPIEEEGMTSQLEISLQECENLSYIILLGCEITEEFPILWLRLKAAINKGASIYFLGHYTPEIANHLSKIILHQPGNEVETFKKFTSDIGDLTLTDKQGAIFVGSQYLANTSRYAILNELVAYQKQHSNLSLNLLEGSNNSIGSRYAGMHPDFGPMGKRLDESGLNVLQVLEEGLKTGWDVLYVAGANPAVKFPKKHWDQFRSKLNFLVVQDLFLTETAEQADVVLPSLSFVEKGGSFISIEKRVEKLFPGKEIPDQIFSDSAIFTLIAQKLHLTLSMDREFLDTLKPGKVSINYKLDLKNNSEGKSSIGHLTVTFAHALFDDGVRMLHNSHLKKVANKKFARIHPEEGKKWSLSNGNTVFLQIKNGILETELFFDETVAMNTIVLPVGFKKIAVQELGMNLLSGMTIEMSKKNHD